MTDLALVVLFLLLSLSFFLSIMIRRTEGIPGKCKS
jgi:hypothetical protein